MSWAKFLDRLESALCLMVVAAEESPQLATHDARCWALVLAWSGTLTGLVELHEHGGVL